jgi:hypothetical protein
VALRGQGQKQGPEGGIELWRLACGGFTGFNRPNFQAHSPLRTLIGPILNEMTQIPVVKESHEEPLYP